MSKVSLRELNKALSQSEIGVDADTIEFTPSFCVYHIHNWNHGYESWEGIEVDSDGNIIQGNAYSGTRRSFYSDFREMISFLIDYLEHNSVSEIIIAPCYRDNQFTRNARENDIYKEIYGFLRSNGVRRGERTGIKLPYSGNIDALEMVVEGAYRDVSELCIFIPEISVLIEPNHHFQFVFWTRQLNETRETVKAILHEYNNLCFYDEHSNDQT